MIFAALFIYIFSIAMCMNAGFRNATGVFSLYFFLAVFLPYIHSLNMPFSGVGFTYYLYTDDVDFALIILAVAFAISLFFSVFSFSNEPVKKYAVTITRKNVFYFSIAAIIFFLIYVLLSYVSFGSIEASISGAYKRTQTKNSLANLRIVFFWGAIVFSTLAFYGYRFGKVGFFVSMLTYLAVLLSLLLALVDGGRSVLILFVLSLFLDKIIKAHPAKFLLFVGGSLIAIVFVSYGMILLRYNAQGAEILEGEQLKVVSTAFTGLSYIDHFIIAKTYVDENGHDWGQSYINAFLSFVPRDLFPDKPELLAAKIRYFLFGDYTGGIPAGYFGEGYIAFGVLGVVAVSVVYGRILFIINRICRIGVKLRCPFRLTVAGIFIPLIGFTFLRGGIDIAVFRLGVPAFWTFVAWLFLVKNSSELKNSI